jgi:hypothetical protein
MQTKTIKLDEIRKRFEQAGFAVSGGLGDTGPFEVHKYNCVHRIDRDRQGVWAPVSPAHFLVKGLRCELEDQGYQKFWLCDGKRFPIRQEDLKALQRFDQEVRHILGLKSLYNESLGSTCARSVYDRVEGRPDT